MPVLRWPERSGDRAGSRHHGAHRAARLGEGAHAAPTCARDVSHSGSRGSFGPARPSADDWGRLEPALDALLDAAPDRRADLLDRLSGGDAARRGELERMLAECERGYPLLDAPAAERFATVFGDETPAPPETIGGRYRVVREAGRGGMAIVYLARDLKHGRDVAVKVVRPELALALGRSRFLREIEIAARLR